MLRQIRLILGDLCTEGTGGHQRREYALHMGYISLKVIDEGAWAALSISFGPGISAHLLSVHGLPLTLGPGGRMGSVLSAVGIG